MLEYFLSFCRFSKRGFNVKSYGSGTHVKLPGSAADKPNIYAFDTTYQQMYDDLLRKDYTLYPEKSNFNTSASERRGIQGLPKL